MLITYVCGSQSSLIPVIDTHVTGRYGTLRDVTVRYGGSLIRPQTRSLPTCWLHACGGKYGDRARKVEGCDVGTIEAEEDVLGGGERGS